jgi:hypothetical protein
MRSGVSTPLLRLPLVAHLPQLRLGLLCSVEARLFRCESQPRHSVAGFFPEQGLVQLGQLFPLLLGDLVWRKLMGVADTANAVFYNISPASRATASHTLHPHGW